MTEGQVYNYQSDELLDANVDLVTPAATWTFGASEYPVGVYGYYERLTGTL